MYLTQGSKNKISVEADENLQEIIITEVKEAVLKIYVEKNIWRAKARKVYVTIETLEAISATSGSDVYTKETIKVSLEEKYYVEFIVNNCDMIEDGGGDPKLVASFVASELFRKLDKKSFEKYYYVINITLLKIK